MSKSELPGESAYGSVSVIDLPGNDPKSSGRAHIISNDESEPLRTRANTDVDGACAAGMAKPVRQLVPPDGGWGWMVVLGVAVCNATTQSLLSVFGLLFADTLRVMGEETTGAAIISNTMVAITNFSGLITGPVMRHFTYRQVAMAGGVLVAAGMFLTSMVTQMWHLLLSYSILVGLGLGLLNPSTFVAVNAYFTRSRGRAVGLSLAGTGLGQMLMPHAVRLLLDEYSFHGAVLVLSAVALHSLAGAMLFQPLRWHARPAPVAPAPASDAPGEHARLAKQQQQQRRSSSGGRRADAEAQDSERQPLTGGSLSGGAKNSEKNAHSSREPIRKDVTMGDHMSMVSSIGSDSSVKERKHLEAFSEKDYIVYENQKLGGCCAGCWARWVRVLDLDLLTDPSMATLLAGLAAVYTAGVNFNMLYPFYLADSGLPRGDVALCMSVMAGLDITGRLLLPPLTDRLRVPARITYLVGALVLAGTRSLVALQTTMPGLIAASALCGFVRAATTVNLNLAISESCSPDKLPGALGINMVIKGISILVLGLFIGWLRDSTGSFTLCMHVLSLIVTLPMMLWLVEIWVQRRRRRHHQPSPLTSPSPPPSPPPYEASLSPLPSPSSPGLTPTLSPKPVIKAMMSSRLQGQR